MRYLTLIAVIGGLAASGCATETWTGYGQVCDYDANCFETFDCREAGGTTEIHLPYGSFATGNDGWEWQEDLGGRCGEPPA